MTKDIQWVDADEVVPGNSKYPALLARIKSGALARPEVRHKYAFVTSYKSEGTARDLAVRLSKSHEEFDIIARKSGDVTIVYAQLNPEVLA